MRIEKTYTNYDNDSISLYFNEIRKIDTLSLEEEKKLIYIIKEGNSPDKELAINKLVESNLRFVISIAKQYQNLGVPLVDLINEGNIGLIKSIDKFDTTKGFRFLSYSVNWIRKYILDSLNKDGKIIRTPLNNINILNKIKKTKGELEKKLERTPSDNEVIEEIYNNFDFSIKEITNSTKNNHKILSIEETVLKKNSHFLNNSKIGDLLENNESIKPDAELIKESTSIEVEKLLNKLTPRESNILQLHFGIGENKRQEQSLEDIGELLNLTKERVRQIKQKAINKLKEKSELIDF